MDSPMKRGRGRPKREDAARTRSLNVSDPSWEKLEEIAAAMNLPNRSALVEAIARGELQLTGKASLGESLAN